MTIDLYVTGGSIPSMAVHLTAKHLGIEINIRNLDMWKNEHLAPEFDKINPLHTVPTIVDNGFILWESRAIMEYLVNKYAPDSNLYPKDPTARALVTKALYFDGTSLVPALIDNYYGPMFFGKAKDPEKEESFKKQVKNLNTVYLGKDKYVAGSHVTLADIAILSSLSFVEAVTPFDFSEYPNVSTWLQTLKTELPSYEEVIGKPLKEFKTELDAMKLS